jgi:PAS domain S-box-containing protein
MDTPAPRAAAGGLGRWAWVPIPLLMTAIAVLWAADLHAAYESPRLLFALNLVFTGLVSVCIAYLAGRGFVAGGQRGPLMLGCGALLWGAATMAASALVDHGANAPVTVHNLGLFGSAICHLLGVVLGGRVARPARRLAVDYAVVLAAVPLLAWAVVAGWTPVFFVQGQGGTALRQLVLVTSVVMFLLAAWRMLGVHWREGSPLLYWYGLGLALLAIGLVGVMLQPVHGGVLGWTGRGAQFLGGAYMLVAAVASVRRTGKWRIGLTAELRDALRESEERYRSLFDNMTEGFSLHEIITNAEGRPVDYRFLEVNPAFERLTGLKRDAVLGRRVLEVLPDTEAHWIENFGRVALTGEPAHVDNYSAELERWYEVYAYRPAAGQFAVIFTDVTERKRAEDALRESVRRFRTVADYTYDWEYWRNPDGSFGYVSPSCEQITGYTREDFFADPGLYLNIIHPDDRDRLAKHMREDLADPDACELEFRILRRDGQQRWLGHVCRPVLDEDGRPVGRRGSNRDVTDRKLAEEALRDSEQRLNRAQEIAHLGSWELDLNENALTWSDEVYRIFGLAPQQFPPTYETFLEHVHPVDRAAVDAAYSGSVREGRNAYEIEHRIVRQDTGEVRWVRERCQHVRDADGRIVRSMGMVLDVTGRKQAEEEIKAALAEKEVLLKEIHHRVKNNMQVISSLASFQAREVRDAAARAALQDVTHRVRSMAMVHEKLYESPELARIEFGEYARSLLDYLWRAHGSAAAGIRLDLDVQPVRLPVDKAVPCGLLLNELVANALKHAFDGRDDGRVTVQLRGGPDGRVCLCVGDDGAGMPPGLDWRKGGSLGLRLVDMLARQLRADVEVTSRSGTEFTIHFAVKAEEASPCTR